MEEMDMIVNAGYKKPINKIDMINRMELTKAIKMHYALFRCKGELNQVSSGLSIMGVGDALKKYRDIFSPLFLVKWLHSLQVHCIYSNVHITSFNYIHCIIRAIPCTVWMCSLFGKWK